MHHLTRCGTTRPSLLQHLGMVVVAAIVACVALTAAPETSHANNYDLNFGPSAGWYMPVGATVALTNHGGEAGYAVGGELSIVHFDDVWFGLYADALHDTSRETTRISVGPEFGFAFVGVDAGAIIETGDTTRFGLQGRLMFTAGYIAPYLRVGAISEDAGNTSFTEAGILFKLPLDIGSSNPLSLSL